MKKFWDYCRIVFVSPEALIGLCIVAVTVVKPGIILFFAQFISSKETSIVIALVGVPIALCGASYNFGESLLSHAAEKGLAKWDEYWRLKHRVYFSWMLCGLDLLTTYGAWYLIHQNRVLLGASAILVGWAMCAVSIASLAIAKVSLRDIVAADD